MDLAIGIAGAAGMMALVLMIGRRAGRCGLGCGLCGGSCARKTEDQGEDYEDD